MAKFKKGDFVICVEGRFYNGLTVGKIYSVFGATDKMVAIEDDYGVVSWVADEAFGEVPGAIFNTAKRDFIAACVVDGDCYDLTDEALKERIADASRAWNLINEACKEG